MIPTTISAFAGAASLAGSVGLISASVSIGVAAASNSIANDIESYVSGSTITAASLDVEPLKTRLSPPFLQPLQGR